MLDAKLLRNDLDAVARVIARRGVDFPVKRYESLEEQRKTLQVSVEDLRQERNTRSKNIGKAKGAGEDIEPLLKEVESLGTKLDKGEEKLKILQSELNDLLLGVPNLLDDSVPDGADESDNAEERRWGNLPEFDFEARPR